MGRREKGFALSTSSTPAPDLGSRAPRRRGGRNARVLDDVACARLRKFWDSGASVAELAAMFGCSPTTVRRWLFEQGLPKPRRRPPRRRRGYRMSEKTRRRQSEGMKRSWAEEGSS